MAKKNNLKKLFESTQIESADVHPDATQPTPGEQPEVSEPAANPEEKLPTSSHTEESAIEEGFVSGDAEVQQTESASGDLQSEGNTFDPDPEAESTEATGDVDELPDAADAGETSTDEVLDDVRRSLIEEETEQNQRESKWWRRLGRKGKRPDPGEAPVPVEIDLPNLDSLPGVVEVPVPEEEAEEDIDQIEDLIHILEAESRTGALESAAAPEVESVSEPEPEIDFEELKKQAFQPRPEAEDYESLSDVRSIALEGGEEVLVEVEAKTVDPMDERVKAFENALKPYKRYIYYAMALLGTGMAVVAALILFNVYQQSRPEPVREPSDLPYPTAVSLPGGWSFQLGRGTVQNGAWDPAGAEWLEGTEVCRWVSLPWSTQLEAVLRTLNPQDPIELVMSNNDKLVYEVYSIRELSPAEMQQLDSNSPCLLLILTGSGSEERWVLTALP